MLFFAATSVLSAIRFKFAKRFFMKTTFLIVLVFLLLKCSETRVADEKSSSPNPDVGAIIHPYNAEIKNSFSPTDSNTVTLANWDHSPYNRWSYQHFRELVPTQNISR